MVNIFHPFGSAEESVSSLDNARLGKQRLEAKQIILNIEAAERGEKRGFTSHPASRAYEGHLNYLKYYYNLTLEEWARRGMKNTMAPFEVESPVEVPWFAECVPRMMADRAALIRKYPAWYLPIFGPVDPLYMELGYLWVSNLSPQVRRRLAEGEESEELVRLACAPLSERMAAARPCRGVLKKGGPCRNTAYNAESLCGVHSADKKEKKERKKKKEEPGEEKERCQGSVRTGPKAGLRCSRAAQKGESFCARHL